MSPNPSASQEERFNWLRLARTHRVGPVTFQRFIDKFGSASEAIRRLGAAVRAGGSDPLGKIKLVRKAPIEREMKLVEMSGAQLILGCDPEFPQLLAQMTTPPPLICAKGKLELLEGPSLAMVGARNASAAGLRIAQMLARGLGEAGYIIVSGLARGIDAQAHRNAMQTGTIAVIAGGIDTVYPPEHADLQEEIFAEGLVISETPFGHQARARDFPKRNALIAGLSLATIVVEAARRSGSLITARLALEQNREVMAVPGSPLDPRAAGANELIKNGAALVAKVEDVLELMEQLQHALQHLPPDELDLGERGPSTPFDDENLRKRLLSLLSPMPVHLDELIRLSEASPASVTALIVELELEGLIETQTGGTIIRL